MHSLATHIRGRACKQHDVAGFPSQPIRVYLGLPVRYWSADKLNADRLPLFRSVDGGHGATSLFAGALHHVAQVQVIHNLQDSGRCRPQEGYCNLSLHYQMLLELFLGASRRQGCCC
jgi:hypothetical protein